MTENVFVIGLGLIGGSLALNIKKTHHHLDVIGFDINQEQLELAKTLGVIDQAASSLQQGAEQADYIVIAIPVTQAAEVLKQLERFTLKQSVIVTDVGSTKEEVVKTAEALIAKGIEFIGGHPMAGSHKSGVAASKAHLFENAMYVLTPSSSTSSEALDSLKELLSGTKAKIIVMSPKEHDKLAGVISHFPHIIAASLVHQAEYYQQDNQLVSQLAAGGFRDITRIASSSPAMWRDILLHNQDALLSMFDHWLEEMNDVRNMIERKDANDIYTYFSQAKQFRDQLPVRTKGAIPSFYDLYVDVPDYPGIISEVTGYLAEDEISITNIRILETREDIYGVLRLSFQTEEDRKRARACLHQHQYQTFIS
ncbi:MULTISPECIES: prephenate dehydrogenase [Priestia]|uniref:prephenate dehydrogenase n=1 Tax=Priestia TaxID=2800373 RepID=UPI00189CE4B0|nr:MULTISPECIES: prephenate dehydrogenase [Priestia]MCM3795210.1 prephenate dehydrogenase [Priestia megaterium]